MKKKYIILFVISILIIILGVFIFLKTKDEVSSSQNETNTIGNVIRHEPQDSVNEMPLNMIATPTVNQTTN